MPVVLGAVAIVALVGAVLTSPIMAGRESARTSPAVTAKPLDQILGLAPGMSEPEAREHLRRVGERSAVLAGGGRGRTRELWEVHDARYACVLVGFEGQRVRVVQGFVRARGRGLRFAEVGDPREARRPDGSAMEWDVRSGHGEPARIVTARGRDPILAGSVAIRLRD